MTESTIGVFVGSVREGRAGEQVRDWIVEAAKERDIEYRVIDLVDHVLPLMSAAIPPAAANKTYDDEHVTRFSQAIDECDGFLFVTPEYNHSVPGPMKNAFDSLGGEWVGKPVAFVGYGAEGGVRAVEAWRPAVANLYMPQARAQVALRLATDFGDNGLEPEAHQGEQLTKTLDELEKLVGNH